MQQALSCCYWRLNDQFCCVHHSIDSQCFSLDQTIPKIALSRGEILIWSNAWFLGHNTRQFPPANGIFTHWCSNIGLFYHWPFVISCLHCSVTFKKHSGTFSTSVDLCGPGRAFGLRCVCVCKVTFGMDWDSYWPIQMKFTGQGHVSKFNVAEEDILFRLRVKVSLLQLFFHSAHVSNTRTTFVAIGRICAMRVMRSKRNIAVCMSDTSSPMTWHTVCHNILRGKITALLQQMQNN